MRYSENRLPQNDIVFLETARLEIRRSGSVWCYGWSQAALRRIIADSFAQLTRIDSYPACTPVQLLFEETVIYILVFVLLVTGYV
jgi:hypothetical protein